MTIRGGGGHLYKKYFKAQIEKHREIGHEHRENTGNLILTRTWPPWKIDYFLEKNPIFVLFFG